MRRSSSRWCSPGWIPRRLYKFCGTAARGGNYNNRWSVHTLTGAGGFIPAHQDGSLNQNIFTAATYPAAAGDLGPNQVALNTGHNKAGSVVCWNKIQPAGDGTFRVESLRYLGHTPFGSAADPGTSYAYGFEAIYLAEYDSTGDLRITEDPVSQRVAAGTTATLHVGAESLDPIDYQWQKAPPGSDTFTAVAGANSDTYVTPVLTVADDGVRYRCRCSSFALEAISDDATISVDGVIPTLVSVRGSIDFDSVYVVFSEPMKLAQLGDMAHYALNGGVTISSVVVLDSTLVRLRTSPQAPATVYQLTVNGIEDAAGNSVPANSTRKFASYARLRGAAGVQIWDNLTGGAVSDLRNNARYPLDYDVDFSVATFDSLLVRPGADYNVYGGRMRAYLVPEQSGSYEFFLRADDAGELRLGPADGTFEALDDPGTTPIATVTGAGPFQETGSPATSAPVPLEVGRKYPIQAIWKESNGADFGQVAWRLVGDTTPAANLSPLPTQVLEYYGLPRILRISLNEVGEAVIDFSGTGLEYTQDFQTWTDLPGVTSPYVTDATSGTYFYRSKN
jgi:hypothetical protein